MRKEMMSAPYSNVPAQAVPLSWDLHADHDRNMAAITRAMAAHADRLPQGCSFDEASLLTNEWSQEAAKVNLTTNGWEHFNEAVDVVYANPFGNRYVVEYAFYRHETTNWRMEVMRILEGFSPLHMSLQRLLHSDHRLAVPHLSFKPKRGYKTDPELGQEYDKQSWGQAYSSAVQHMKDQAYIHAQTCQSTYGMFSYWVHQDATQQFYVKPRVNLRDDR